MLDVALNPLDQEARGQRSGQKLVNWGLSLLDLGFCLSFGLFVLIIGCAKTFSPLSIWPMIFITAPLAPIILVILAADRRLVLKVVMLRIVVVYLFISPAIRLLIIWLLKSVLVVPSAISLFFIIGFIVPLLILLIVVASAVELVRLLILASGAEAGFVLVTVLRLLSGHRRLGARSGWVYDLVVCFLHYLIIFIMFPFLILICF
mgnify:CR=1 FL=1